MRLFPETATAPMVTRVCDRCIHICVGMLYTRSYTHRAECACEDLAKIMGDNQTYKIYVKDNMLAILLCSGETSVNSKE